MLRNYLIIALRVLRKHKLYASLNVFGLAVGIASCLLIFLFVRDELSYDRFHERADRIYRVVMDGRMIQTSALLAPALEREFPEVERAVRISGRYPEVLVTHAGGSRYENRFFFTDSTFFQVFSFPLLRGDPSTALTRPFTVVISEEMAARYFGEEDPVGQTLDMKGLWDAHDYEITGVARNAPHNSHFKFNFLASFGTRYHVEPGAENIDHWSYVGDLTYVMVRAADDVTGVEAKIPEFVLRHQGDRFRDRETPDLANAYTFQPITSIHLHSQFRRELEVGGEVRYLYVFSVVALLILLIAGINYTNLATARSAHRAREVGIRKVVGARRGQLTRQFLSESVVLTVAALALALVLVWLALPAFNRLTGKPLSMSLGGDLVMWLAVLGIGTLLAMVAGLYPALFLSGFQPARVLKGTARRSGSNSRFGSGLVVAQFAASVALIVGTITVQHQLDYMQEKRLGLNPEQVVALSTRDALDRSFEAFKGDLLTNPHIRNVTSSWPVPPMTQDGLMQLWASHPRESEDAQAANAFMVGVDFPETLEIPIVAGRSFRAGDISLREYTPVIINRAAVEAFGWEEPLGMEFPCCFNPTPRVVGVVEDFHYQSLKEAIAPLALIPAARGRSVLVRVETQDLRATLDFIEDRWRAFAPGFPFEFSFMDEHFAQVYDAEERLAQIFGVFALLAILLACLGLFGLAAFAAERRTKEIGIRKVLGASVTAVVTLLSKDFLKLVLLGIVVAVPVAWLAMHRWLEDFAYRVDVSWWSVLAAGLAAIVIALATVSYHAVRAASVDPVRSLRYE